MTAYDLKFAKCYERFSKPLTRFVCRNIGDWDSSEEIVQDIFTYLYEKKEPLDIDCNSVVAFIFRVARHRIIDHYKKTTRRNARVNLLIDRVRDPSQSESFEEMLCEKETAGKIRALLESSQGMEGEIVCRKYSLGQKVKQISRELALSKYKVSKAVRNFNNRAREKLGQYYCETR